MNKLVFLARAVLPSNRPLPPSNLVRCPDPGQASSAIADTEQDSQGDSKSLKIWNKFFENALLSHTGGDR